MKKLSTIIAIVASISLLNAQTLTITETLSDYAGYGVSTFGATDGSIDLTTSGGVSPYSYLWNNGSTDEDLLGLAAGTYDVTVTDSIGDTLTGSYTLTEPPAPLNVNMVGADPKCTGNTDGWVDAQASGGTPPYSYLWDNGSTDAALYNLGAGNYNVTVTDADNNDFFASADLYDPQPLTVDGAPDVYPNGQFFSCETCNDAVLTMSAKDGTPPYTYLWHNGETNNVLSNITQGESLSVTVTDANSCTANNGGSLIWIYPIDIQVTLSSYPNGYNISAEGMMDGSIEQTVTGGAPPYSFNWADGSIDQNRYGLDEGMYDVTIADAYGTQEFRTYDIVGPPPAGNPLDVMETISFYANGYNISAEGMMDGWIELTVNGGTAPYSFAWGDGTTDQNRYGLDEGMYDVTVTDDVGDIVSETYYINTPPPGGSNVQVTANISQYPNGYNISAEGMMDGSIELTATGGTPPYTYNWGDGSSDQNRYGLGEGEYHATVTDDMGNSHGSNYWILGPPPGGGALSVNLNGYYSSCKIDGNLDAMVNGGAFPYNYSWSGPNGPMAETSSNIYISEAGEYFVTVTDMNNDNASSSIMLTDNGSMNITVTSPTINGGANNASCAGGDGTVDIVISAGMAPYNIEIYGDDGYHDNTNTSSLTHQFTGLNAGDYHVVVRDMEGCDVDENIELTGPGDLTIDITPTELADGNYFSCPTCADGEANGSVTSGGNGNFTYQWFSFVPGTKMDVTFEDASIFTTMPIMFEDFDESAIAPLTTGQTVNNLDAETWYGLYVVDDEGCEGGKFFSLKNAEEADPSWKLNGNSGAGNWLGTNDATDLELKANNQTLLKLEAGGATEILSSLKISGVVDIDEADAGTAKLLVVNPDGSVARIGDDFPIHSFPVYPEPCRTLGTNGAVFPYWETGENKIFTVCEPVNVGIGTSDPLKKLDVRGAIYGQLLSINTFDNSAKLTVKASTNDHAAEFRDRYDNVSLLADRDGQIIVGTGYFNADGDQSSLFLGDENHYIRSIRGEGISIGSYNVDDALIIKQGSGKVGIGVDHNHNFGDYKLSVCGDIRATKLVVEEGWCDYVFDEDYYLRPLSKVKDFIKENKHLPGIPKASVIETDGLDLGELVKLQMEKIEELTLYMIELEEKVEALESIAEGKSAND